ncbi:MAG: HD domain-containing protein [Bacteroidales bacterium]|nr:HD domain-containing protein [Bacteroidales bacterium]
MTEADITPSLKEYVEREIIPRYASFDLAHRVDHARSVIRESLSLATYYDLDPDMVYAIAAYHDTGLCEGRDTHHTVSARIILEDRELERWFTPEQIRIMAEAAEDHRASKKSPPRTIYGRIVAEADRLIDPDTIIRRTIQYSLSHYPSMTREEHFQRVMGHLKEKYGYGGYLHLYIPESPNAGRLDTLRKEIEDPSIIRRKFDTFMDSLEKQTYKQDNNN